MNFTECYNLPVSYRKWFVNKTINQSKQEPEKK